MPPEVMAMLSQGNVLGYIIAGMFFLLFLWGQSRIRVNEKRETSRIEQEKLKTEQDTKADEIEQQVELTTLNTLNVSVLALNDRLTRLQREKDESDRAVKRLRVNVSELGEIRAGLEAKVLELSGKVQAERDKLTEAHANTNKLVEAYERQLAEARKQIEQCNATIHQNNIELELLRGKHER